MSLHESGYLFIMKINNMEYQYQRESALYFQEYPKIVIKYNQ